MPLEQAVLDYRVLERIGDGEDARCASLVVGARRDRSTTCSRSRAAGLHRSSSTSPRSR